jgi:hypothetical protein
MPVSNFGLTTLTRASSFGGSWSNLDFAEPSIYNSKANGSIQYLCNSINTGYKLRVVARTIDGSKARTIPGTLRVRIKKRLK